MRLFATLLIALLVMVGCTSERLESKRLTQREVTQIAIAFAQRSGLDLDNHRAPRADFQPALGNWWVMFSEKPPGHPGGDIIVLVNDTNGVAELFPSR